MTGVGTTTGRVDGRTLRAERTRAAIVDAHMALIGEGDLRPTGERIAERAGISLRALWTNFKDMEALFAASGEKLAELQAAAHRPIDAGLPLPRRIDLYCEQRARMLEMLAPCARAAALREPFSAQLKQNRVKAIAVVQAEIEEVFTTELALAGSGAGQLLQALVVASTWASWSMLRDELGLGLSAARGVLTRTVSALLAAAITSSLR